MLDDEHRARTFYALAPDSEKALAFYTLSISVADGQHLHPDITRGALGNIPFLYLNYLAVSEDDQNRGVGSMMLGHALDNCAVAARIIGSYGVGLHALTNRAGELYYRYGFRAVDPNIRYPFMILSIKALFDLQKIREEIMGGSGIR
jgi:GNAT superfamily N-acetyltransferase